MAKTQAEVMETRYIRELRKENQKLKRELAQERKKNKQLAKNIEESEHEEPTDEIRPCQESTNYCDNRCNFCGTKNLALFTLGERKYFKCHSCGTKGIHS